MFMVIFRFSAVVMTCALKLAVKSMRVMLIYRHDYLRRLI